MTWPRWCGEPIVSSWSFPYAVSRTGASHTRRNIVCQDASGWQSLTDCNGQPVHLIVVADGHGGQRYTHSDVGSRLACELALQVMAAQLGKWSSVGPGAAQRWREWLGGHFPRSLHQNWLAAVEAHWCQGDNINTKEFSPLAYGTTLAVVVMAPDWWGHTGLGDWDLVRIHPDGEAELVSQEADSEQAGGEATYSLSLNNAHRFFAARTAVHPITAQDGSFSVLLSTDGVRKSCRTDADFFTIARYLCKRENSSHADAIAELIADLDRISNQGCGDDVSIAIGHWQSATRPQVDLAAPPQATTIHSHWQSVTNRLTSGHLLLLLVSAGTFILVWLVYGLQPGNLWGGRPTSHRSAPEIALSAFADKLCKQPERIRPLLNTYGKLAFYEVRSDPSRRTSLVSSANSPVESEQINALIAWVTMPEQADIGNISIAEAQLQRLQACDSLIAQAEKALNQWDFAYNHNENIQGVLAIPNKPSEPAPLQ